MNRYEKYLYNQIQKKAERNRTRWCSFKHEEMADELNERFREHFSAGDVHQMVVKMNKNDTISADITSRTARNVVTDDTLSGLQKEIFRKIKKECSNAPEDQYSFKFETLKYYLENEKGYGQFQTTVIRDATKSLRKKGYIGGMIRDDGVNDAHVRKALNVNKFTTFEEFRRARCET